MLPDIERGPTWSEDHRALCEARMIARFTRPDRLEYYNKISRRRGPDAAQTLSRLVNQVYRDE